MIHTCTVSWHRSVTRTVRMKNCWKVPLKQSTWKPLYKFSSSRRDHKSKLRGMAWPLDSGHLWTEIKQFFLSFSCCPNSGPLPRAMCDAKICQASDARELLPWGIACRSSQHPIAEWMFRRAFEAPGASTCFNSGVTESQLCQTNCAGTNKEQSTVLKKTRHSRNT